jgi:hypothetical protein
MTRSAALAIVVRFAFNFAISKARSAVEDAIDAVPYDKLGWWEMQEVWRNQAKELAEMDSFYLWSVSGIDHDEFTVAKWMLGETVVHDAIRANMRAFTPDTLEALGQSKLERKKAEGKKENVDDWVVDNR